MSKKFLGKLVAGAALGGASLLVVAPGAALADDHSDGYRDWGQQSQDARDEGGNHWYESRIFTHPKAAKPGHDLTIIQICQEKQRHAWAWSEVTGKVELQPKYRHKKKADGDQQWSKDGHSTAGEQDGTKAESSGTGGAATPDTGTTEGTAPMMESGIEAEKSYGPTETEATTETGAAAEAETTAAAEATTEAETTAAAETATEDAAAETTLEDMNGEEAKKAAETAEDATGEYRDPTGDSMADQAEGDLTDQAKTFDKDGDYKDDYNKDNDYKDDYRDGDYDKDGREHKWVYFTSVKLPEDAEPGAYKFKGSCAQGRLMVLPRGHVDGGDGGMTTNGGMAAGGAGMLGAATIGGLMLLRRRSDATLG